MGQLIAGIILGIVMCMVAMLVRCVLWYEKKHPEDDYWHRSRLKDEESCGE